MSGQADLITTSQQVHDLRHRVAKLERTVAFLLEQLKLEYTDTLPVTPPSPEVLALVRSGKKIDAIKLYRQLTGEDIEEAKRFIESLE